MCESESISFSCGGVVEVIVYQGAGVEEGQRTALGFCSFFPPCGTLESKAARLSGLGIKCLFLLSSLSSPVPAADSFVFLLERIKQPSKSLKIHNLTCTEL